MKKLPLLKLFAFSCLLLIASCDDGHPQDNYSNPNTDNNPDANSDNYQNNHPDDNYPNDHPDDNNTNYNPDDNSEYNDDDDFGKQVVKIIVVIAALVIIIGGGIIGYRKYKHAKLLKKAKEVAPQNKVNNKNAVAFVRVPADSSRSDVSKGGIDISKNDVGTLNTPKENKAADYSDIELHNYDISIDCNKNNNINHNNSDISEKPTKISSKGTGDNISAAEGPDAI